MDDCKNCEHINDCRNGTRRSCVYTENETRCFNFGLMKYEKHDRRNK